MDKYTKASELFNACTQCSADEVNTHYNKLLVFLHDNFDVPESTQENLDACNAILKKEVPNEDILCNPPKILDVLYPIAIARMLLADYCLPLIASKIPELDTFNRRYGRLIIESMTQK